MWYQIIIIRVDCGCGMRLFICTNYFKTKFDGEICIECYHKDMRDYDNCTVDNNCN